MTNELMTLIFKHLQSVAKSDVTTLVAALRTLDPFNLSQLNELLEDVSEEIAIIRDHATYVAENYGGDHED